VDLDISDVISMCFPSLDFFHSVVIIYSIRVRIRVRVRVRVRVRFRVRVRLSIKVEVNNPVSHSFSPKMHVICACDYPLLSNDKLSTPYSYITHLERFY
jgi:hypothetical protein